MSARRPGLSVTELQDQIFQREGFRVSFARLGASRDELPPYDYRVMAPQGWTVNDWRRIRLASYVPFFRDVTVYRGDETPIARDMKLGHLRDTYYKAEYGTLTAGDADEQPHATNVISIDPKRERATRR